MNEMYAQLGTEVCEIVRTRPRLAFTEPVWWCPFCDYSNQEKQDNLGGPMPCGKCGAVLIHTAPEPPIGALVAGAPEQPVPARFEPERRPQNTPQPRTRGIGPSRRGRA